MLLLGIAAALSTGGDRISLLELYEQALVMLSEEQWERAAEVFTEISGRMPHVPEARYDLASALFGGGLRSEADSVLSTIPEPPPGGWADSLVSARACTGLATAIDSSDYAGVRRSAYELMEILRDGRSYECDRRNLEAALNWLAMHEPNENQDQQNPQDQQDQQNPQDQQDQQNPQDQQDQQNPQDQQDQQNPQDQQDQQNPQDQQDQRNPQDQQDQRQSSVNPETGMTREQARLLLEMVEEAEPASDSLQARQVVGAGGGPDW